MRLLHYSSKPLERVYGRAQDKGEMNSCWWKPSGLWVSVKGEDDWPSWCMSEDFRQERLAYATEVVLKPLNNVLVINGAAELREFHEAFKQKPEFPELSRSVGIDWDIVAGLHDGIIIAPYIWQERLGHMLWYYTWDCASGCIWNPEAIERLNPAPGEGFTADQALRSTGDDCAA